MCACVCVQFLLQLLVAEDCVTAHHTTPQMDSSNLFSKPVVQIPTNGRHLWCLARACGLGICGLEVEWHVCFLLHLSPAEVQFHDLSYFEPTLNNDIFLATFNNTK